MTVLNASNEAAVYLFLNHYISFLEIEHIIAEEINKLEYERTEVPSLEERILVGQEVYQNILKKYGVIL